MQRKRKFETLQEVQDAYATPDENEDRETKRKRRQNRLKAISRFRQRQAASVEEGGSTRRLAEMAINDDRVRQANRRANMTASQQQAERDRNRDRQRSRRTALTPSQRAAARERDRDRQRLRRAGEAGREEQRQQREPLRDHLSANERQRVRNEDRAARQSQRSNQSEQQQQQEERVRNRIEQDRHRSQQTEAERQEARDRNRDEHARYRASQSTGESQIARDCNREEQVRHRSGQSDEQHEVERNRNTQGRGRQRAAMTDEERELQRERDRMRRHRRQYGKGFAYHEDFDPTSVDGRDVVDGRHYIPRATHPATHQNAGAEKVCDYCGAWKLEGESGNGCCLAGAVRLPQRRGPPLALAELFKDAEFLKMARVYNNVFAFTSVGATRGKPLNVDSSVAGQGGVFNFRVMGSMCHRMGSLLPPPEEQQPKFAQIYMNDPDVASRVVLRSGMTGVLDHSILTLLEEMMQEHNPYAQQFLNAREILLQRRQAARDAAVAAQQRRQQDGEQTEEEAPSPPAPPEDDLVLRLHVREGDNSGTNNTPTALEVAAIIIDADAARPRDNVLYTKRNGFERIYETNVHYDPLQYPLLHPYGEQGWTYTVE